MGKHVRWTLAPLTIAIWVWLAVPSAAQGTAPGGADGLLFSTVLAWLVPIGLGMLACGTVPPERVPAVMRVGWLALGLSVIGYWLCGFAFQFGGLGFASAHPELAGLAREWTLSGFKSTLGSQWGVIGLAGYLLRGPAGTPAALRLFWTQLPWITTAVAVYLWAIQGRVWPVRTALQRPGASGLGVLLVLGGLLQAALYTLVGNWVWGGGWLANLGLNLGLGHGFVDYGGTTVHLLAAASALVGMVVLPARRSSGAAARTDARQLTLPTLSEPGIPSADVRWTERDEPFVPMPALHLPVLATAGAWLALLGWVGWSSSTPLHATGGPAPAWPEQAIGLLLAAAGGALCALFSSWLTTGQGNALMTARGVAGALVAASAGLPFYPLWAALAVGAGAGLLIPLVQYVVDHLLRLEDVTSAVAVHGAAALWGVLAVGLLSAGMTGAGWNGVGPSVYLDVAGQGVSGILVAPGYAGDWPGQFQAQAFGAAAIVLPALLVNGLLMGLARGVVRAWHGEAVPGQTARPARGKRARRAGPPRASKRTWHWPQIGRLVPAWLRRRATEREDGQGKEANHASPAALENGLESFGDSEPLPGEDSGPTGAPEAAEESQPLDEDVH